MKLAEHENLCGINIRNAEKHYGGRYVGDFCIKNKDGNWANEPVAVFYQPNPPEGLTNKYFGLFVRDDSVYIVNADSAFDEPITGIVTKDNLVYYSRYRHDYREIDGLMIDGGRDYVKTNTDRLVEFTVVDGEVVFIGNPPSIQENQVSP